MLGCGLRVRAGLADPLDVAERVLGPGAVGGDLDVIAEVQRHLSGRRAHGGLDLLQPRAVGGVGEPVGRAVDGDRRRTVLAIPPVAAHPARQQVAVDDIAGGRHCHAEGSSSSLPNHSARHHIGKRAAAAYAGGSILWRGR